MQSLYATPEPPGMVSPKPWMKAPERLSDSEAWTADAPQLPGWIATAATRDPGGSLCFGVTSDVHGVTILTSADLRCGNGSRERPSKVACGREP